MLGDVFSAIKGKIFIILKKPILEKLIKNY